MQEGDEAGDRHAAGAESDLSAEEQDDDGEGTQSDDEQRHAAMLAAVSGAQGGAAAAAGGRGGRRGVPKMVSEAYPESGYNLAPEGRVPALNITAPSLFPMSSCSSSCPVHASAADIATHEGFLRTIVKCRSCARVSPRTPSTEGAKELMPKVATERARPNLAVAGEGGALRIADLVGALGKDRAKLGAARKILERLDVRAEPVAPPLPSQVRARKERQAGCAASPESPKPPLLLKSLSR